MQPALPALQEQREFRGLLDPLALKVSPDPPVHREPRGQQELRSPPLKNPPQRAAVVPADHRPGLTKTCFSGTFSTSKTTEPNRTTQQPPGPTTLPSPTQSPIFWRLITVGLCTFRKGFGTFPQKYRLVPPAKVSASPAMGFTIPSFAREPTTLRFSTSSTPTMLGEPLRG